MVPGCACLSPARARRAGCWTSASAAPGASGMPAWEEAEQGEPAKAANAGAAAKTARIARLGSPLSPTPHLHFFRRITTAAGEDSASGREAARHLAAMQMESGRPITFCFLVLYMQAIARGRALLAPFRRFMASAPRRSGIGVLRNERLRRLRAPPSPTGWCFRDYLSGRSMGSAPSASAHGAESGSARPARSASHLASLRPSLDIEKARLEAEDIIAPCNLRGGSFTRRRV